MIIALSHEHRNGAGRNPGVSMFLVSVVLSPFTQQQGSSRAV